jgi:hypothetical protein
LNLRLLTLTLLAASACGDSAGLGTDAGAPALAATFDNIQEYIFAPGCATQGCHTSERAAGGLPLGSADESYQALLNVPAVNSVAGQNGWLLVKPGDPELSFLVRKIDAPGLGEGAPMPITTQLTPFYQQLIENWILAGALR